MSHEIKYNLKDPVAAQEQAIADSATWLSMEIDDFKRILTIGHILSICKSPDEARLPLSFVGIQGYPVEALWNFIHKK